MLVWAVAGDASGMLLVAVVMIYVQLLAVMAVTIFFSTIGSAILASVLGICVFVAGQLSHNVLSLHAPRQERASPRRSRGSST